MATIKNQFKIGSDLLYPETSADCVKYNSTTVKNQIDNILNPVIPSASTFGQKILACKSADEMAALINANTAKPTFYDECEHTWGVNGSPALTATNKRFGSTCLRCASGSNILLNHWQFCESTGSFTMDFWACTDEYFAAPPNYKTMMIIGNSSHTVSLCKGAYNTAGNVCLYYDTTQKIGGSVDHDTARVFYRITYNNGVWKLYRAGVLQGSFTQSFAPTYVRLGSDCNSYFDEFRILQGVVLGTDVPSEPFKISDYPDNTFSLLHFEK